MKKMIFGHWIPVAGLVSLVWLFAACSQDLAEQLPEPTDPELAADMAALEAMGFDVSDLVVEDDAYRVEGDILIAKETLDSLRGQVVTRQSYFGNDYKISPAYQNSVGVRFLNYDIKLPAQTVSDWEQAFRDAISDWNNEPNSNLKFDMSNSATGDIYVELRTDFSGFAQVTLPSKSSGVVYAGNTIKVNPNYNPSPYSMALTRRTQAAHLLGHAIGFAHTDYNNPPATFGVTDVSTSAPTPESIPGTQSTDQASVMIKNNFWSTSSVSSQDKTALRTLYPLVIPTFTVNTSASEYLVGAQITFNLSFATTPPSGYTISWAYPGMTYVSGQGTQTLRVSSSTVGPKTVTATVTLNGESKPASKTITIASTLVPGSISPASQTIKSGSVPNITHSGASGGTGSYSYTWYYKLSTSSTWTTSSSLPTLTNTGTSSVTYQFVRRITSGSQTKDTNTVTVTVAPVSDFRVYSGVFWEIYNVSGAYMNVLMQPDWTQSHLQSYLNSCIAAAGVSSWFSAQVQYLSDYKDFLYNPTTGEYVTAADWLIQYNFTAPNNTGYPRSVTMIASGNNGIQEVVLTQEPS